MVKEIAKKRGRPPGSGRKEGSPDKRRNYVSVREQLEELGFDPVYALVEIARDICVDIRVRKSAIKDLLDKTHPDLRAIEIQRDDSEMKELAEIKDKMTELLSIHISDH